MMAFLAVVALFVYVWRTRRDLDATIQKLSRRLEALESGAARAAARTHTPAEPPIGVLPLPMGSREHHAERVAGSLPYPEKPATSGAASASPGGTSLEAEIGARWLLYIGVLAVVVGAAYFQKLAIENDWIGERARVVEGILAGLALVGAGRWFVARGYDVYGQILAGGGVAVLYVSIYAATTLYELVGPGAGFTALCAVTVLAAWLADRYRSQGLAVVAVGGGFLSPFLLPTAADAQVTLFTYVAVLIAALMYLSHRRVWPLLNVVSYVLTVLTILAWAATFYTPSKYLVTEVYLTIFTGMFLFILLRNRRSTAPGAKAASAVLSTAPVFYYLASLVVLGPHSSALLVFLGLLASGGAALAPYGRAWIRLGVWVAAVAPLLAWVSGHLRADWLMPGLAAAAGIYSVTLLAQLYATRSDDAFAEPGVALLHLNPLVSYAAAHWMVGAVYQDATALLAFGAATWNLGIAAVLWRDRRQQSVHFSAVAATLFVVAIGVQFDGEARVIGWAAEGAAVAWLGLRERRAWLQAGGIAVFGIALLGFFSLLLLRPDVDHTLIFNRRAAAGLFMVALLYGLAWLYRAATPGGETATAGCVIAANLLTLIVITSEIGAFWDVRARASAENAGRLGRELTLSISWAIYATALTVVGLWRAYAPIRYLAIGVFAVTIVKVFFFDLSELEQIYRVLSVLVLGMLLLLTSYLYNRSRRGAGADA